VLQQGEYTTVGGRTPIKTDVRIVAASNKDLRILIQQGLFREDLFFRLNVVPLRLPPLRERIEDLPDLIRHFFALAEKDGLPPKKLDALALERMKQHRWPGNVRELEDLGRQRAPRRRQSRRRGRGLSVLAFLRLSQRRAAARPLSPHLAGNRGSIAHGSPGGDPRQSNPRRRPPGPQPQHAAEEDPRSRHSGLPKRQLGLLEPGLACSLQNRTRLRVLTATRAAELS
jgi:transcriptional regulator with GAF, ATPase, and Fis domain